MVIEEIFEDIEWDSGYVTIHKSENKRGHSLTADIKLCLPGQSFNKATFKCKVSLQARLRDFRRKCNEVDTDLIKHGMIEQFGWHEEVFDQLHGKMVYNQRDSAGWLPKFMRFGVGRQPSKWAASARYGPSIAGVIAGYDPGSAMFGVSVGKFNVVVELDKTGLSPNQIAAGVIATGWIKHKPMVYSGSSMRAASAMKRNLQAAIASQRPKV